MNYKNFIQNNNIPFHYFRDRKHPDVMSLHMLIRKKGNKPKKFTILQEYEDTGASVSGVWTLDRNTTAVNEDGSRAILHPCDIVKQV